MLSSHRPGGGKPWTKVPVHSVLAEVLSWFMESYNLVTCCDLFVPWGKISGISFFLAVLGLCCGAQGLSPIVGPGFL